MGALVGLPHARRIAESGSCELAAVCDLRPEAAMAEFKVPGYTDAGEMAAKEEMHGVVIATPTHLHLPALKSLLAGLSDNKALKAVLVEKPICESVAAAREFIELADAANVKVLVGHQRRHSALATTARKVVRDRQTFGPLRGITCQWALLKPESYFDTQNPARAYIGEKGKGGPVLINMIHDLDLIRFITGKEISRVFASTSGSARDNDVEDSGSATLVFEDGSVGSVFFSDAAPSANNYEFVTGENKKYPPLPEGEVVPDCYQFFGGNKSLAFPSLRTTGYNVLPENKEAGWDAPLTMQRETTVQTDPLKVQMEHFVDVCHGMAEPLCSGRDGLESLLAILAIQRSAETGEAVQPSKLEKELA